MGLTVGALTNERSILMGSHIKFDEVFRLIKEYKKEYGHCNVPQCHKTASGISLGVIVSRIRQGGRKITPEQKAELDAIGFVWRVRGM